MFLDHTQRRSTVRRTPLDEWPTISAGERPAAAHLLKSWVRIPPGAWIFVCCECRVLSGTGLCDELITRPEESCRLWCVVVCDLETSRIGAPYIYDISNLRVNCYAHEICALLGCYADNNPEERRSHLHRGGRLKSCYWHRNVSVGAATLYTNTYPASHWTT